MQDCLVPDFFPPTKDGELEGVLSGLLLNFDAPSDVSADQLKELRIKLDLVE